MNILDTRDLNKRLEELQSLKQALEDAREELAEHQAMPRPVSDADDADQEPDFSESVQDAYDNETESLESAIASAESEFDEDAREELAELENLESEISDWRHGETMIPESDFEEYAMQYADDVGAIDSSASWPLNCIDWKQAAGELAMDYTTVTYQGTDYYVRA